MNITQGESDSHPTVLLIDSDLNQCTTCKTGLESQGYRVVCRHSGKDALYSIRHEKIDLVVSEIVLPDMSGMDLISTIASKRERIPIVINTTHSTCKFNFRSWAADAIVEKSGDLSELYCNVSNLLH